MHDARDVLEFSARESGLIDRIIVGMCMCMWEQSSSLWARWFFQTVMYERLV